MSIGEDQEARIMSALCGLVCARVQARLPEDRRGIRALDPVRARVPAAVEEALERVVAEVAAEVEREVEPAEPFMPEGPA